ncbi:MAG: hypothetical protein ACXW61_12180 [Gemmatirosa sp.]
MSLELVPLVLGALVALVGLGLVADGWLPDSAPRLTERRRRARAERDGGGEALIGLGLIALAAALAGRDVWRWSTVAVLLGVALLVAGALRSRHYLVERLLHRGTARRGRRRDRRTDLAAGRPAPLAVASDVDRRGGDRRDLPEPPADGHRAPLAPPSSLSLRGPGFADRPVVRRSSTD